MLAFIRTSSSCFPLTKRKTFTIYGKVKNRLSIVPYAGITQIRCGRSLTLPLRLYTDSHILYGHMIAQNKKKCQGNCLQKNMKKSLKTSCSTLYSFFYLASYQVAPSFSSAMRGTLSSIASSMVCLTNFFISASSDLGTSRTISSCTCRSILV